MTLATDAEVNAEIGRRVRQVRKAAGVTQVALAMHLGVSSQQLLKYETGANRLSVRALLEIAEFLGTDVGNLLPAFADAAGETVDMDLALALERLDPSVRRRINDLVDAIRHSEKGS